MPIHSETELYAPVKHFFERLGYEVKAEVLNCDLVAMRGEEEPVLVELKKTFNLPLVIQGIERLQRSDRVYLAVERPATGKAPYGLGWGELVRLCRRLGLGLLTVRFYKTKAPVVEALCDPEPFSHAHSRRKVKTVRLVREFKERSGDYNVGGSTKVKLVTSYREKALACARCLHELGGRASTRDVRRLTGYEKAATLMRINYYRWFEHVDKGHYALTPIGQEALATYAHVLEGLPRASQVAVTAEDESSLAEDTGAMMPASQAAALESGDPAAPILQKPAAKRKSEAKKPRKKKGTPE